MLEKYGTCNICGQSTHYPMAPDGLGNYIYAELKANWPYGSKYDMTDHQCIMCESCYDKVMTFIVSLGGKTIIKQCDAWTGTIIDNEDIFDSVKHHFGGQ